MNEFQTINDVINSAIRDSSYISVLISSGVFILYTLINKVVEYFKSKAKNKPLIEMANAVKDVSLNIVKLNNVLDKVFKDFENKEQNTCKTIIKLSFAEFKGNIIQECIDIIIRNNINVNSELIKENVAKLVSAEFYKIYSILNCYQNNNVNLATKLDKTWIKETTDDLLEIIYDGQDNLIRIGQLSNRLNANINTYIIHLNNKIFV